MFARPAGPEDPILSNRSEIDLSFADLRPLGVVSDFVVEKFPRHLNAVGAGTSSSAELYLAVEREIRELSTTRAEAMRLDDSRLGLLDLMVLSNGLKVRGAAEPPLLTAKIAEFSAAVDELPWLTYDLIVRTNPFSDVRTFTGLDSEREFYRYHELIEARMSHVVSALRSILNEIDLAKSASEGFDGITGRIDIHIKNAADNLDDVNKKLAYFAKFPPDEFRAFRPFFIEEPGRPGASGLFSGHMQTFSIALMGKSLGRALERVVHGLEYYPSRDHEILKWALDRAGRESALYDELVRPDVPGELLARTIGLFEAEWRFLTIHRATIRNAIREVYDGNGPGTGGEPVKTFIDGTIELYAGAIRTLKQKGGCPS